MCARFSLVIVPREIEELYGLEDDLDFEPRFNIAPTQPVLTISTIGRKRGACYRRWGLIPSWAKDPSIGQRMINARSETVLELPAYRDAFRFRRCVIPATAFFEWTDGKAALTNEFDLFGERVPQKGRKLPRQPLLFHLQSGRPMSMAGLYDTWKDAEDFPIESTTVLTCEPNALIEPIHDRMPVLLDQDGVHAWLDPDSNTESLVKLLIPAPSDLMGYYPVSSAMNDPRFDNPDVLKQVSA